MCAPVRLCVTQTLNVAKAVGIAPRQRTISFYYYGVDGTNAPCQWVNVIHPLQRSHLVRNGQIATGKAQHRQSAQGLFQMLGLHRQHHIGATQLVLCDPVVVDDR